MERPVRGLQFAGLGLRVVRRLPHGGDDALHARGDAPVRVHDARVDVRKHGEERFDKRLRLCLDFLHRAVRDEGARPILGVLIQPLALRSEQFRPEGGIFQRRHVPLRRLQRVLQLCRLKQLRPRIGRSGDPFFPAFQQHAGGRVHVVRDAGIGVVQPFQQFLADLDDLRLVRNAQPFRHGAGSLHHRVVQVLKGSSKRIQIIRKY